MCKWTVVIVAYNDDLVPGCLMVPVTNMNGKERRSSTIIIGDGDGTQNLTQEIAWKLIWLENGRREA